MTHEDYMRQALALAPGGRRRRGRSPWAASLWTGPVRSSVGAATAGRRTKAPWPMPSWPPSPTPAGPMGTGVSRAPGSMSPWSPAPCAPGVSLSARIPELYYGAKDAGFGACGSILNLFEEDFRHHPKIVGHILEEECAQLLQDFFAQVRKKKSRKLKDSVTFVAFFVTSPW